MKLSELKELGEKATQGRWVPWIARTSEELPDGSRAYLIHGAAPPHECAIDNNGAARKAGDDAALIAAMRNHWDALLQVADKARIALVVSSTSNMLAIKEALEELERVK